MHTVGPERFQSACAVDDRTALTASLPWQSPWALFLDAAWTDDIQVMLMVCQKANFDYKSKAAIDVAQENQ